MELESESCTISQVSFLDHHSRPRGLPTRGGHCHRSCSHSCDRGQNILTIVFVWPLDRSTNGALTVWPHTLNTNCLLFLMLMAIKMQPSWPHYRVWKLSLTAWPTPKTALDPLTASWPRSQLWLWRLWEWPPLDRLTLTFMVMSIVEATRFTNRRHQHSVLSKNSMHLMSWK